MLTVFIPIDNAYGQNLPSEIHSKRLDSKTQVMLQFHDHMQALLAAGFNDVESSQLPLKVAAVYGKLPPGISAPTGYPGTGVELSGFKGLIRCVFRDDEHFQAFVYSMQLSDASVMATLPIEWDMQAAVCA